MNRNMEAITWALHARGISPTAFRLLIQLCSHVNSARDDFDVWPKHKTIAKEAEISVSGVKRHIAELVDGGFIEVRPSMRDDGAKSSNVYRIMVNTQHQMPGGVQVNVTSGTVQSDPCPQPSSDLSPQVTADPCKEPLEEITSEILNITPPPTEPLPLLPAGDLFEVEFSDSKAVATKGVVEKPAGVADQVWADFVSHRKRNKADITSTALANIQAQAQIAGWTLEAALTESVARGWKGFKASWVQSDDVAQRAPRGASRRSWEDRPSVSEIGMDLARARRAARMGGQRQAHIGIGEMETVIDIVPGMGSFLGSKAR